MTRRRAFIVLAVCSLMAGLAVRTPSQTSNANQTTKPSDAQRWRTMSEQEKKREIEKRRMEWKLARAEKQKEAAKKLKEQELKFSQKRKEAAKEGRGPLIDRKKKQEEAQERAAERRKEFLEEKAAIEATEEQWKLIKPKLERLRQLREQANSRVGLGLGGGPSENQANPRTGARQSVPTWQWNLSWEDKAPGELTESQKIAKQLIALVERENAAPGTLKRTMDGLRKARREEAEIEKQLVEARNELREILTTRQEAALVLMNSF